MSENNLAIFEDRYMATMQRYADLEKTIAELEETKKKARAELQEAMEYYNIRSIDNDYLKITLVSPSTSITIDTLALRAADPDLYDKLIERFKKVTDRRASLRVKVK